MKNEFQENMYPCHVPDRVLSAALFKFDLPKITQKIMQEDLWKTGDRNAFTLVKNGPLRIIPILPHEKSEIDFHQPVNPISIQLIGGELSFRTTARSLILKKAHYCLSTSA